MQMPILLVVTRSLWNFWFPSNPRRNAKQEQPILEIKLEAGKRL